MNATDLAFDQHHKTLARLVAEFCSWQASNNDCCQAHQDEALNRLMAAEEAYIDAYFALGEAVAKETPAPTHAPSGTGIHPKAH